MTTTKETRETKKKKNPSDISTISTPRHVKTASRISLPLVTPPLSMKNLGGVPGCAWNDQRVASPSLTSLHPSSLVPPSLPLTSSPHCAHCERSSSNPDSVHVPRTCLYLSISPHSTFFIIIYLALSHSYSMLYRFILSLGDVHPHAYSRTDDFSFR